MASKIKVRYCVNYVYTVYIYYVYKYEHMHVYN